MGGDDDCICDCCCDCCGNDSFNSTSCNCCLQCKGEEGGCRNCICRPRDCFAECLCSFQRGGCCRSACGNERDGCCYYYDLAWYNTYGEEEWCDLCDVDWGIRGGRLCSDMCVCQRCCGVFPSSICECLATWTFCCPCAYSQLYRSSLSDAQWSLWNHCCVLYLVPCVSAVTLRTNLRTKYGIFGDGLGDCCTMYCCCPCACLQHLRAVDVDDWRVFKQPEGGYGWCSDGPTRMTRHWVPLPENDPRIRRYRIQQQSTSIYPYPTPPLTSSQNQQHVYPYCPTPPMISQNQQQSIYPYPTPPLTSSQNQQQQQQHPYPTPPFTPQQQYQQQVVYPYPTPYPPPQYPTPYPNQKQPYPQQQQLFYPPPPYPAPLQQQCMYARTEPIAQETQQQTQQVNEPFTHT